MRVVSTHTARCQDCYRCVRTCPVKAIRVMGAQAEVVDELCIVCASCVRACSQEAKVTRDDLPAVKSALAAGRRVIAHERYLRRRYGDEIFIVFIGPCIAKKCEIVDEAVTGVVDAAITFTELEQWARETNVAFPAAKPEENQVQRACARLFPLEGGLVGTALMDTDILASHIVITSGMEACRNVLDGMRSSALETSLVELMACEGGCINGPAMMDQESMSLARQRVIAYATRRQPQPLPTRAQWPSLERKYRDRSLSLPEFTEEQIQEVLHRVDKHSPEDELNCGACGYDSCRQKATAVLRGMAEATMCIPYMRARAESLTNVVVDVTPNAVLIVDKTLHVQDISPSAERMFHCHRVAVRGKPLREIIPIVDDFLVVRDTGQPMLNKIVWLRDDLTVEQSIMTVRDKNLMVGILRDVTEREHYHREIERIRRVETLQRTQEMINKQMRVAHEIAGLLGETTAETKTLLTRLAHLIEQPQDQNETNR